MIRMLAMSETRIRHAFRKTRKEIHLGLPNGHRSRHIMIRLPIALSARQQHGKHRECNAEETSHDTSGGGGIHPISIPTADTENSPTGEAKSTVLPIAFWI
jgi:hypothetical protein